MTAPKAEPKPPDPPIEQKPAEASVEPAADPTVEAAGDLPPVAWINQWAVGTDLSTTPPPPPEPAKPTVTIADQTVEGSSA